MQVDGGKQLPDVEALKAKIQSGAIKLEPGMDLFNTSHITMQQMQKNKDAIAKQDKIVKAAQLKVLQHLKFISLEFQKRFPNIGAMGVDDCMDAISIAAKELREGKVDPNPPAPPSMGGFGGKGTSDKDKSTKTDKGDDSKKNDTLIIVLAVVGSLVLIGIVVTVVLCCVMGSGK